MIQRRKQSGTSVTVSKTIKGEASDVGILAGCFSECVRVETRSESSGECGNKTMVPLNKMQQIDAGTPGAEAPGSTNKGTVVP